MTKFWKKAWLVMAFVVGAATFAMAEPTRMPMPGSLNSIQGQVIFDGQRARPQAIRREALLPRQTIRTRQGKAGLLLTPGSYLRIGDNSEVQMLSTTLENTQLKVMKGTVLLDARAGYKHDLVIAMDGTRTRIRKKGIFGFNANRETISVLRGKAIVYEKNSHVTLKHKRQLYIAGQEPFEVRKLNKQVFKSSALYQWNKVRNRYESRAKKSVQQSIAQSRHWYGPGWYWSGFWGFYTYLHSSGMYYSPFNNPTYGPWAWNSWGWWGWGDGDGD